MIQMQTTKGIEELRPSAFHVQLGRGLCAAFIAQQQGISLSTALKKVEEPIGDLWLVLSEFARQGLDLSRFLRQPVKTQNSSNGELSHGIVS
jgi:hypothetical protein